jgi:hypothetical protein
LHPVTIAVWLVSFSLIISIILCRNTGYAPLVYNNLDCFGGNFYILRVQALQS